MGQFILLLVAALVVGAIVFGVAVLIAGDEPGIEGHEPDGRAVPLPSTRPLAEGDLSQVRFDTAIRGYRMGQVDAALRRAAYDIGYKEELIQVLEAEVNALRDGRTDDADALRRAREAAMGAATAGTASVAPEPDAPTPDETDTLRESDGKPEAELRGEPEAELRGEPEAELRGEREGDGAGEPGVALDAGEPDAGEPDAAEQDAGEAAKAAARADDADGGEPEPPPWSVERDDSWRRSSAVPR